MKRIYVLTTLLLISTSALAEWKIDLSRRQKDLKRLDLEELAAKDKSPIESVFEKEAPKEEIVIANTDKGFIPNVVRLKKDQTYQISVVNVNKNKKNVSFMLDAFAEHHGTYFGEVVSFNVKPLKEGLFQFQCPEAEFIGKLLVSGPNEELQGVPPVRVRQPAEANDPDVPPAVIRGYHEQ